MLKYITILFISFSLSTVSQAQEHGHEGHEHEQQEGQTGGEGMQFPPDMPEEVKHEMRMDMDANEKLMEVDSKIRGLIEEIKEMYDNPELAELIYQSQESWEEYRHTVVMAKFPPLQEYGQPKPYCIPRLLVELSQDRLETIKKWAEGIDDHECTGSMKSKREIEEIKKNNESKD